MASGANCRVFHNIYITIIIIIIIIIVIILTTITLRPNSFQIPSTPAETTVIEEEGDDLYIDFTKLQTGSDPLSDQNIDAPVNTVRSAGELSTQVVYKQDKRRRQKGS